MAKFIIKDFKKWLKEQPEDRLFYMLDSSVCLFASFLKETGQETVCFFAIENYCRGDGKNIKCPDWSQRIQRGVFNRYNPWSGPVSIKDIRETCRELKIH